MVRVAAATFTRLLRVACCAAGHHLVFPVCWRALQHAGLFPSHPGGTLQSGALGHWQSSSTTHCHFEGSHVGIWWGNESPRQCVVDSIYPYAEARQSAKAPGTVQHAMPQLHWIGDPCPLPFLAALMHNLQGTRPLRLCCSLSQLALAIAQHGNCAEILVCPVCLMQF